MGVGGGWGGYPHRAVVYLDVFRQVDELDKLESVVLAPSLVGLRRAHVVQVDALVHLRNGQKKNRGESMFC